MSTIVLINLGCGEVITELLSRSKAGARSREGR